MNSISYPNMFNKNTNNMSVNISYDLESIRNSLRALFYVNQGELLGDPSYGNKIREKLFNISTKFNILEIKKEIAESISKSIPMIYTSSDMIKIYGNDNNTKYKIVITYSITPNNDLYTFETIISN